MPRTRSVMATALALLYVSGTIVSLDLYSLPAAVRVAFRQVAQGEVLPESNRRAVLSLGTQKRIGENAVTVSVEFAPSEKAQAGQIRVEIEFPASPWRFEKVVAPSRSSLEISVKQRGEERETPEGAKERTRVLSLVVSASRGTIPAGTIGELRFALDQAETSEPILLAIREWEISRREHQPSRHRPMLEPPSGDSGMNPVTGCFFFTH
ncbi:MAG: hypothetical protein HYX73_09665 [Acidobacteria bacterium]|nr:hypothetical protein [Acidobacteriota bacterium]